MLSSDSIHGWAAQLRSALPLSRPQALALASWSVGVAATGCCGQSTVSQLLAHVLDQSLHAVRQRLREFCYEAQAKRGPKRRALEVQACFSGLLAWVVRLWQGHHPVLAFDATGLKDDLVVLSVSVVVRAAAVPVAWRVLYANRPQAWKPHWLALVDHVRRAVPPDGVVLATTDRGLYAPWLFEALVEAGLHPLMRVRKEGYFRPESEPDYRPLETFAPAPGTAGGVRGTAFKKHPLAATLLTQRGADHAEPWYLLTDLAPPEVDASWYGQRAWIEQGFKDLKRGGFQWQRTRMTDPERVSRFWLVLAVASLWLVAVGTQQDARARTPRPRRLSVFRAGWVRVVAWLMAGPPLPAPALALVPDTPLLAKAIPPPGVPRTPPSHPGNLLRPHGKLLHPSSKTYP